MIKYCLSCSESKTNKSRIQFVNEEQCMENVGIGYWKSCDSYSSEIKYI